jgi:hypothetical protein
MTTNWMNYKVGQEVYIPCLESCGKNGNLKVLDIKKNCVYLNSDKDMQGWVLKNNTNEFSDGEGLTFKVYESKEAYIAIQKIYALRESMRNIEWRNYSDEQVNAIAEMIGIES